MSRGKLRRSSGRPRPWRAWVHWEDEDLLGVRISDLDLRLKRTTLELRVKKLYSELDDRGFRFRPPVWLSSEWFSPDGVPGIAVPFYLAHPRLMKLESKKMYEVEGGSHTECMRILRHEAGHALDTAYRLHFRRGWQKTFGLYSEPYPDYYSPRPNSRKYVLHLDAWYAQAHPAEDFAETFAVWLTPRSDWRQRYRNWPAVLKKLRYVDELMREIADQPPKVRSRARPESVSTLHMTLREYYEKKRERYAAVWPHAYDRDLKKLFSNDPRHSDRPTAASFLRGLRREIRDTVSSWTGHHPYTVDQVLQDMMDRCRGLKLRLARPRHQTRMHAIVLVCVQTMRTGRFEIPL